MEKVTYYYRRDLSPAIGARYWRLMGPLRTGAQVLDVGCGIGALGRYKPTGIQVIGIDNDERALRAAAAFEEERFVDLESGCLPFEDQVFSGVFAKDIIEHVLKPEHLLAEIRRVLAPGGRLVVSVPMEYPWVVWNDYTHHRGFTKAALAELLRDCRFDAVVIEAMGSIPGAGRLGLVDRVPRLLSFPGMRRLFGRSWEAHAMRPFR